MSSWLDRSEIIEDKPKKKKAKAGSWLDRSEVIPEGVDTLGDFPGALPPGDEGTVAKAGSAVLHGGAQGMLPWIDEIEAGVKSGLYGSEYQAELDDVRTRYREAQEGSPVAYLASEMLAPSPLGKISKGVKIAQQYPKMARLISGAAAGFGAAEGEAGTQGMVAGLSGMGAVALPAIGKGMENLAFPDKKKLSMYALNAGEKSRRSINKEGAYAVEALEDLAGGLEEKGLFQGGRVDYNIDSGKFVNLGKRPRVKGANAGEIHKRIDVASKKLNKEIEGLLETNESKLGEFLLDSRNPVVPAPRPNQVDRYMDPEKYAKDNSAYEKFLTADKLSKEIQISPDVGFGAVAKSDFGHGFMQDIAEDLGTNIVNPKKLKKAMDIVKMNVDSLFRGGQEVATARDLLKSRRRLYKELSNFYKSNAMVPKNADLITAANQALARKFKERIVSTAPEATREKITRLLGEQSNMLTFLDDVKGKAFKGEYKPNLAPATFSVGRAAVEAAQSVGKAFPTERLNVRRGMDNSPKMMNYVESLSETGTRKLLGMPIGQEQQYREPQSLTPLSDAMQDIKLQPDSNWMLENKPLVKAKFIENYADEMPEAVEAIDNILDKNPEKMNDMLPILIQEYPDVFLMDKYNRIDGKISDPMRKAAATSDVYNDQNLTNMQRTALINQLNKTGELDYGLPQEQQYTGMA